MSCLGVYPAIAPLLLYLLFLLSINCSSKVGYGSFIDYFLPKTLYFLEFTIALSVCTTLFEFLLILLLPPNDGDRGGRDFSSTFSTSIAGTVNAIGFGDTLLCLRSA